MKLVFVRKLKARTKARSSRYVHKSSMYKHIDYTKRMPTHSIVKSLAYTPVHPSTTDLLSSQQAFLSPTAEAEIVGDLAAARLEGDDLVLGHDGQAVGSLPFENTRTSGIPIEATDFLTARFSSLALAPVELEDEVEPWDDLLDQETHGSEQLDLMLAEDDRRERMDLLFGLAQALVEPIYAQLAGKDIENETMYTGDDAEDKRIDEVLGYLTHRVAAWLEYLQLIPQHAVGGFNTPPAGIVTLALWIVLQIPVHTDYRRPFPFAAPAHTPTMTSIQHILSTGFSGDSDVVLDATERLIILGLSLAHRMIHNLGSWQDGLRREWHEFTGISLEELELLEDLAIAYLRSNIDPLRSQYASFLRSLLDIHGLWHSYSTLCPHEELAREALNDVLWTAIGVPVRWVDDGDMSEYDSDDENTLETPIRNLDDLVHIIEGEVEEKEEQEKEE